MDVSTEENFVGSNPEDSVIPVATGPARTPSAALFDWTRTKELYSRHTLIVEIPLGSRKKLQCRANKFRAALKHVRYTFAPDS